MFCVIALNRRRIIQEKYKYANNAHIKIELFFLVITNFYGLFCKRREREKGLLYGRVIVSLEGKTIPEISCWQNLLFPVAAVGISLS